jgi:hypothetical protein
VWCCSGHGWCCAPEKSKACGATKPHPTPLLKLSGAHQWGAKNTSRTPPLIRCRVCGLLLLLSPASHPHSLPSHLLALIAACAMQCQCRVAHATNAGVVKAPVIAQKCPQDSSVGRREAAARGCPRRQQCGLGFVQVSCPLEHTSNPAASVCLLPMPACNLPARLLLSIANCYLFRVVHYMHLGWFRGPTHVHVQHKDTHTEQRGCLALQHRQ